MSPRVDRLASALARAQSAFSTVTPDEIATLDDGFDVRSYRYATLARVWEAIRPVLTREGLAVVQTCVPSSPEAMQLTTTLVHKSGQWIAGTIAIPLAVRTPQAYGSALTYARRYGLAAILGLAVDVDDDGLTSAPPASTTPAADATEATRPPSSRTGWWTVTCRDATASDWDGCLLAYARARRVESATREDVARDLRLDEPLDESCADLPLGDLVRRGRALGRGPDRQAA